MTKRLLSLSKAFGMLDPGDLSDLLVPAIEDAVRRGCGGFWCVALRPALSLLLVWLVVAIQGEIEDALDLRAIILSSFLWYKAVLNFRGGTISRGLQGSFL